jgi:hypothetical protein
VSVSLKRYGAGIALAWMMCDVRNARGESPVMRPLFRVVWTFVLDKGDGGEDEVGEGGVEEADTHRVICWRL